MLRAKSKAVEEERWLDKVKDIPPAFLAAPGVVIYVSISILYSRFYGSLGTSPEEVGLSYANTLTRSLGLLILTAAILLFLYPIILYLARLRRPNLDQMSREQIDNWLNERNPRSIAKTLLASTALLVAILPLLIVFIPYAPWNIASIQAKAVERGTSVAPYRLGPFPILDLRATPVSVEWKNAATPKAKSLAATKLFYLGESKGTAVLYNPLTDETIRAPIGELMIVAANCEVVPQDSPEAQERCGQGFTTAPFNLANVDFSGANLYRRDLKGANLSGANLRHANLEEANLESADLRRADLRGTNLRGANLREALLDEAIVDARTIWPVGFDFRAAGATLKP
jgi:hypothetical protein